MYKRILVALDHSDVDNTIIKHTSDLAKSLDATLVLYRVAHYHTRDSRAHELEEAEEYLAELCKNVISLGISCETAIGQGEPGHAICEDAERLGCDLIAMPTHGHNRIARFLLGSVAEDVKRNTTIPLLLVKAG